VLTGRARDVTRQIWRPRKPDSRREMIPMRRRAAVSVAPWITWVEQARTGAWKYLRLLVGGHPAGNSNALVLEVFERSLGVVSEAVGECQSIRYSPVILRIRIMLPRSNVDKEARSLAIGCRNAKQKVRGRIAGTIRARGIEVKRSAVVDMERIAENKSLYVRSEFQTVASDNFAEIVEVVVVFVAERCAAAS